MHRWKGWCAGQGWWGLLVAVGSGAAAVPTAAAVETSVGLVCKALEVHEGWAEVGLVGVVLQRAQVVGVCAREVMVGGYGRGGVVFFCPTGRIAAAYKSLDRQKVLLHRSTLLQVGLG